MNGKQRWPWYSAGAFALLLAACAGAVRARLAVNPAPLGASVWPARIATNAPLAPPSNAGAQDAAIEPVPLSAQEADPAGARIVFGPDGTIGAWLVAGPFDRARLPDELRLSPRLGEPVGDATGPRWHLASSGDGVIDLASLDPAARAGVMYAGGTLHLERGGRHVLLVGVDDAVTVRVDGRAIFSGDRARPRRDDDDLIPVDLAAGDHSVVLVLRSLARAAPAWGMRVRLLDAQLAAPHGGFWRLEGTTGDDARALCGGMSLVALDRAVDADGYRPVLTVRFRGGAPMGTPFALRARLQRAASGANLDPLFDVDADAVGFDATGAHERVVALGEVPAGAVEDDDWTFHVEVGERHIDLPLHPRRAVREAIAHAARALEGARADGGAGFAKESLDTVEYLRQRLVGFVAGGDADTDAEIVDARELDELAASLEQGKDPYDARASTPRTGAMRRAYVSPADGHFSEFAVYLPPRFDAAKTYPLIVALHGMNGHPMQMLMWLFGHDDPARDGAWEDRHPRRDLEPLESIVVAPGGHFNAMYRDVGEDDVMRVVDWALTSYPIDPARVTITGPSMGGIGAAACALHHPDRFAAAEPLCGYHSYFVRSDIGGRALRPWERFIAEQRSNVDWAENGLHIPLYVVHGTKDLPEENSAVLIDRYEELHYEVTQEHPDLGHNVWQTTYEDLKGALWLLPHRRPVHPREVRFKTPSTRWADDAWLHVRELSSCDGWGEVIARIDGHEAIYVATRGVAALALDRDAERVDDATPVTVSIDGTKVVFQAGEPIELHAAPSRDSPNGRRTAWSAGPATHLGLFKHGAVTGPIRDVFHESVLFVYGASDPAQARANEEVARQWARDHAGVRIDYPVLSDAQFYSQGQAVANDKALFLVGNAKSNLVVRELEPDLPIRIDGDAVLLGTTRIASLEGSADRCQLGAAFIRPNPRRPDRYVVVVEGVGALGTWRSLSLPDMLPDYVVFDDGVAAARGQLALGAATVRAAGFFAQDWSIASRDAGP